MLSNRGEGPGQRVRAPRRFPSSRPTPQGYASAPPSCFFSHIPERLRSFLVAVPRKGREAGGGQDKHVDRRVVVLLEVAQQPAGGPPADAGAVPSWRSAASARALRRG